MSPHFENQPKEKKVTNIATYTKTNDIVEDARQIIETARSNAVRSVDFCRVQMYWNLGKRIFEEEQQGKNRADYGAYIVKNLAVKLEAEYGSGFSERQQIMTHSNSMSTERKSCQAKE